MVQFGKTLNEVVKSDWRCHAVAYMELKRALSDGHSHYEQPLASSNSKFGISGVNNGCIDPASQAASATSATNNNNNHDEDVHSIHTESSYCISDTQKANYFRIYEDSIDRLTKFYEERVHWAEEERDKLEKAVGRQLMEAQTIRTSMAEAAERTIIMRGGGKIVENSDRSSSSTSFLIHQITNFSRDLGLVLEFLELNATAFSKIMKKFDKRTGSNLRETKLKELREQHPYLYDGGELRKCKNLCADWTKQLQLILQQSSSMVTEGLKEHFPSSPTAVSSSPKKKKGHRVTLSLRNSLKYAEEDVPGKPVKKREGLVVDEGENPQESSEWKKSDVTQKTENFVDTVRKKGGRQASVSFQEGAKKVSAPRSIHKTKGARVLEKMIDYVNEELCHQKSDSPFFDRVAELDQSPPPSFASSEVELADVLGEGEFCKIYEIRKFDVPESCHICFLHRGYNDPNPKSDKKKTAVVAAGGAHRKIPSSVTFTDMNLPSESSNGEQQQTSKGAKMAMKRMNSSSKMVSTFSFDYDSNISDYDELESDHEEEGHEQNTRGFMKDHCLRNGEARYAIKRIRSSIEGQEEITDAAVDLAREAEFLAGLKHPNIIRIRGTINVPGHPKYALILDRLYDTLEVQMLKWKEDRKRYKGKFKGLIGRNKIMMGKLWMDRLVAAYDLARAMAYLHSRGILHRDIKPANVGFDIRGDIKIFDFGLAKELKPIEKEGPDQYHTSGLAGTRRYMAPEVAQVMHYGLSADVYSFAILMWEMLTLKAAYENYTREKHYKEIVVEGKRPKVSKSWPFVIKNLLERSWHKQPSERPTFGAICELIRFGLPNNLEDSERTADLLTKSYKSMHGCDDAEETEHEHNPDASKSDSPSDSLSQSIRIKSPHLDLHKHQNHTALPVKAVVEE